MSICYKNGISSEYLPKLLKNSKNILRQHKSGANVSLQSVSKPPSKCNNLCIQVHDKLVSTHGRNISNWDHLIPAVEKYKGYNTTIPLCIWGYALYATHRWLDRVRIRQARTCVCPITFCDHSQSMLSKF